MITKNLKDKTIIVVGGSSGIGLSVVNLAYALGANVTLTGRSFNKAIAVASAVGSTVKGLALDVDDEQAVNDFFKPFTHIDHIHISAGSTRLVSVTDGSLEENMLAFNTRLYGNLRVVRVAANKINPSGSITFTGGVSTDRPISSAWVSGLGTAAAEQLARVLVMELPHIRFNAVAPGYTDTPMWDSIMGENKAAVFAGIAEKLPVKKIASPEEVASAVLFLMSNDSVTGEVIHVDGGSRFI